MRSQSKIRLSPFPSGPLDKMKAAVALIPAALLLIAALDYLGLIQAYQLKTLDLFQRWAPHQAASQEVVVVAVDQPDLEFFKNQGVTWPWPRQLYGAIVAFCARSKARAVIIDILFTETSSYGSEDDARLGQEVTAAANVTLPFFLSREERGTAPEQELLLRQAALEVSGALPARLPTYRSVIPPVPPLLKSVKSLGNVETKPDPDGIYRRIPLLAQFQGRCLPTLALAAYYHQEWAPAPICSVAGGMVMGSRFLPVDDQGQLLLKYRGPSRTYRRFSAANVISSEARAAHGLPPIYPLQSFEGKWVLVGLTAPGLLDLKGTPMGGVFPGVEIHATLLDNLLQGDFLATVPVWLVWVWAAVLASLMVLAVLFWAKLWVVLGVLTLLLLIHLGLCLVVFMNSRHLDAVAPGAVLLAAYGLATAYSYATEGRQKQLIRTTFAQYMSEAVIQDLLSHPEKLRLGGERRRVTVFFSDLAGFTSLSERLAPEAVAALLNRYLSCMTEIILAEAGTVDKFEGDAIMAFWGAPLDQPDQALRACRAALRQCQALRELNDHLAAQNSPPLRMRLGIHTGDAVVGNLGSERRFDYTAIGDTVNLASRLEGLNKFYGTVMLTSEDTAAACGEEVVFRELDLVAVKGREAPVRVLEVLALSEHAPPEIAELKKLFGEALKLYRQGNFTRAAEAFRAVLRRFPEDGPSLAFLKRCQQWKQDSAPVGWDGVFRPDAK